MIRLIPRAALAALCLGVPFVSKSAEASTLCGGNSTAHTAPLTCSNTRVIDGTAVTVALDVSAAGVAKATFTLDAPRAADTSVLVRWYAGTAGPVVNETSAVIPPGATGPTRLSVHAPPGCDGQIDAKAVFTARGDSRGLVAGPMVRLPNCDEVPPPTTTTTLPPTTPPTTAPPITPSTPSPPTTTPPVVTTPPPPPVTPPVVTPPPPPPPVAPPTIAETPPLLPHTGLGTTAVLSAIAGLLVVGGLSLIGLTRRPRFT